MRILHITPMYSPVLGGTEILVQRVSETLVEWGHDVTVLTSDFTSVSGYYQLGVPRLSQSENKINGVVVVRLAFGKVIYGVASKIIPYIPLTKLRNWVTMYAMNFCSRDFFSAIQQQIIQLQPDVVMAAPHLLPNVEAAIQAHQNLGFPFILMPCLHEHQDDWPVDRMILALKETDGVLAMTNYEMMRLSSVYGVKANAISLGGFGVDVSLLSEIEKRKSSVLFLGRKVPSKGIPFLIKAMQEVWQVAPHIRLILAGARNPETSILDEIISQLAIQEQQRIFSLDDISDEKKEDLLRSSLCLVLPSKIESFGGVILEAWAHQTPIITFDLPVFSSFVDNEVNGLLVPVDDTSAMAKAIIQLEQNRPLAHSLGKAGYKKASEQYSWTRISQRFLDAYCKVT